MKHNHNHDNARDQKQVTVRFEFTHPTAHVVCVAGTFNHWRQEAKTMHSSGAGNWWKETLLAPGSYEYCFIADGQWMPDPLARKTVPNPYGGRNSILEVASSEAAGHRANATDFSLKNSNK